MLGHLNQTCAWAPNDNCVRLLIDCAQWSKSIRKMHVHSDLCGSRPSAIDRTCESESINVVFAVAAWSSRRFIDGLQSRGLFLRKLGAQVSAVAAEAERPLLTTHGCLFCTRRWDAGLHSSRSASVNRVHAALLVLLRHTFAEPFPPLLACSVRPAMPRAVRSPS